MMRQKRWVITKSLSFGKLLFLARPAIIAGVSLVVRETLNDYGAVKHFGIPTFTSGFFELGLAWVILLCPSIISGIDIFIFLL